MFDQTDRVGGLLTVLGFHHEVDPDPASTAYGRLKEVAERLSRQFGRIASS